MNPAAKQALRDADLFLVRGLCGRVSITFPSFADVDQRIKVEARRGDQVYSASGDDEAEALRALREMVAG